MNTLVIKPLYPDFNVCVQTLCKVAWPAGFDTSEDKSKAPQTYQDLIEEYAARKRITIWTGASDKTIFDDPQINHMFRAWHDHAHIFVMADFSAHGEYLASRYQMNMVSRRYGAGDTALKFNAIIDCEVNGQRAYFDKHGDFPHDQRAFTQHWVEYGKSSALERVF